MLSVIGMFYFYKKKQTLPFKVCVVCRVVCQHMHVQAAEQSP